MSDHSRINPSKLPALALCPGKLQAEEALGPVEEKPNQAAIDGTRRHALAEWKAYHPQDPWPTTVEGQAITGEDVYAVSEVWPYVEKHPARQRGPWNLMRVEEKVEIGKWCKIEEGLIAGTADLVLVTRDEIEILDFKFGRRLVSPESWQLKAYGVGATALLHAEGSNPPAFKPDHAQVRNIKLTIAQPANVEEPIRSVTYPLLEIGNWMRDINRIATEALTPGAKRIPGEDQCRYCLAAGSCKERAEWAINSMMGAVAPPGEMMTQPQEHQPEVLAPIASVDKLQELADVKMTQDPKGISDDEIGRILDIAKLLQGWLNDIRSEAQSRMEAGTKVPGWKMIAGRSSREWIPEDEEEVRAALMHFGVKKADTVVTKLVSPAQAEKLLVGRKNPVPLGKDKVKAPQLAQIIRVKEGRPKLAPESDPAPAINAIEEMFEAQPEPIPTAPQPKPEPEPDWF